MDSKGAHVTYDTYAYACQDDGNWHGIDRGCLDLCENSVCFKVPVRWGWELPCSTCMCEARSIGEISFPCFRMTSRWPLVFFLHSCSGGNQTPHRLISRATSLSLPKKSCARRLGLFLANGRLAAAAWSYRAEINELLTAFSVHPVFGYAARPLRLNERFLVARFFWGDELSLQCHLKLWRTSICRWWRISREIMTCRGSRLCYGVISLWPCFRCLQVGFAGL